MTEVLDLVQQKDTAALRRQFSDRLAKEIQLLACFRDLVGKRFRTDQVFFQRLVMSLRRRHGPPPVIDHQIARDTKQVSRQINYFVDGVLLNNPQIGLLDYILRSVAATETALEQLQQGFSSFQVVD